MRRRRIWTDGARIAWWNSSGAKLQRASTVCKCTTLIAIPRSRPTRITAQGLRTGRGPPPCVRFPTIHEPSFFRCERCRAASLSFGKVALFVAASVGLETNMLKQTR
jgi:hypothetical protein